MCCIISLNYLLNILLLVVIGVTFYMFLYMLDVFCACLQIYIFCNMCAQLISENVVCIKW